MVLFFTFYDEFSAEINMKFLLTTFLTSMEMI